MIPEIRTFAKSDREFFLLLELAKTATTKSLITEKILPKDCDIEKRVRNIAVTTKEKALKKRIGFALKRFESELRKRGLS